MPDLDDDDTASPLAAFAYSTQEGDLIEHRRRSIRPRLSVKTAAELAGISDTRWRQITKGYVVTGGVASPVRAPDETLARMAAVVGVTPAELDRAGREEAATAMDDLGLVGAPEPTQPETAKLSSVVGFGLDAEAEGLTEADVAPIRDMLRLLKRRGNDG